MKRSPVPILVVDDNESFLRVVRTILEDDGSPFAMLAARSGTEALAVLDRCPPFGDLPRPALIVLDFHLPDMNAPAVLTEIGRRAEHRSIPVLVLSQAEWDEDAAAALAAGAARFTMKPARVDDLRHAIVGFWKEYADAGHGAAGRG